MNKILKIIIRIFQGISYLGFLIIAIFIPLIVLALYFKYLTDAGNVDQFVRWFYFIAWIFYVFYMIIVRRIKEWQ